MSGYEERLGTTIDWDIRYFRRHPRKIPFSVEIKNRTFEAKTVDYCPIGLGIIISDPNVPLAEGDLLNLDIDELNLHERMKTAWINETHSGLRVGLRRIGPMRGYFTVYPLTDLLIGLQRTSRTGILKVNHQALEQKVFIRDGSIIFAESNYRKDGLSEVLLKSRKIKKSQYDKTEEIKRKTGSSYAQILVHMGYIKPQDVKSAIELQAKRIIMRLFLLKDAEYKFTEGTLVWKDAINLKLSIADIVYREVKRNADVELLKSCLLDNVVYFSSNPLNLFQEIRLTEFDRTVISCVDGKRSIRDIIRLSTPSGSSNPLKVIFALLESRFLKIMKKPGAAMKEDTRDEKDTALVREIEGLCTKYKDLDYYNILGVSHDSTEEDIKKAYYNAAKKYHPDKHLRLRKESMNKLTDIFTYITSAYLTLTNGSKRREYDSRLSERDSASLTHAQVYQQGDYKPKKSDAKPRSDHAGSKWNPHVAEQHFKNGKTALWHDDFDEAYRLFATSIYFDPSVASYHYYCGKTLLSLGNHKKAVEALNRADQLSPMDADTLAELGHAYLELGFPLRAMGYFDKAIDLNPSNKRAMEGVSKAGKKKRR